MILLFYNIVLVYLLTFNYASIYYKIAYVVNNKDNKTIDN